MHRTTLYAFDQNPRDAGRKVLEHPVGAIKPVVTFPASRSHAYLQAYSSQQGRVGQLIDYLFFLICTSSLTDINNVYVFINIRILSNNTSLALIGVWFRSIRDMISRKALSLMYLHVRIMSV